MHQTIDVALKADEDTEVGNGLDAARDLVALGVIAGKGIPRVLGALLNAK